VAEKLLRQLHIVVHLPQNMDTIVGLLDAVAKYWPEASFDVNSPGGWRIDLPNADGQITADVVIEPE